MVDYKDLFIFILIGVSLSIFIHLIKCNECNECNEVSESFNNNIVNANKIKKLQQNFVIDYLDNIKKLIFTDRNIKDMKHRIGRINNKIKDKYESETNRKILINTNGEITFLD